MLVLTVTKTQPIVFVDTRTGEEVASIRITDSKSTNRASLAIDAPRHINIFRPNSKGCLNPKERKPV
jgi:sRNA-binding carbon storage regulator CsrA